MIYPSYRALWNYALVEATSEEVRQVESWLVAHPEEFEQLATIHRQIAILRSVPDDVLFEPVPERHRRVIAAARLEFLDDDLEN